MKKSGLVIAAAAAAIVTGCGSKPLLTLERMAPTGIEAGESITVILENYSECKSHWDDKCPEPAYSEAAESMLANCMAAGMQQGRATFSIIPGSEFRAAMFPAMDHAKSPRTIEAFNRYLKEVAFSTQRESLRLRYVVIVRARSEETNRRTAVDTTRGGGVVGRVSDRRSTVFAEVLDVKEGRQVGRIEAMSSGQAGFMVPIVLIIPLLPIPFSDMTETTACEAVGKAVAALITETQQSSLTGRQ